jgi:hypothetical protein
MVNTKNVQAPKLLQRAGEDPEGIRKEAEGEPGFKQQAASIKRQASSIKRQARASSHKRQASQP